MIFRPVFFNVPDKNGDIYRKQNFNMNKIQEKINKRILLGELEPTNKKNVTLNNVSHIVNSVEFDSQGIIADIKILDTPEGKLVNELINQQAEVFLSARYTGIKDGNEIKEMDLLSFDFVYDDPYKSIRKRIALNKKLKKIKNKNV